MSKHLKAFIKEEFNNFIRDTKDGDYDDLRSVEEPFEEHITEAFNEHIQNDMCIKTLLLGRIQENFLEGTEEEKAILEIIKD